MRYLLFIWCMCLISGCCKQLCEDDPLVVQLKGFAFSAVDTVLVTRYAAGDEFVHPLDSAYQYPLSNGRDSSAVLIMIAGAVNGASEYKIRLTAPTKSWLVTHIQNGSHKCPCGNGHYKAIISCTVNGVQQSQKPFMIQP